jgi:restriction system protein
MPVPTYDQFIEPVLRFLAGQTAEVPARQAHEAAADALQLTEDDRSELVPSGVQAVYKNRAGWAHDRLKRAGLSASPRRGHWQLTPEGLEYARNHPPPLDPEEVERLAVGYTHVRLRTLEDGTEVGVDLPTGTDGTSKPGASASPDDRLERALAEIHESVSTELLESIAAGSPKFFEALVLDLLHAMGYGTSRRDIKRVGGSGDGGIDGIISLDRLGLEKVYVQAKKWQNPVGRPDVQAFYGALAGQHATKGVFITTSSFTAQALEFAKSVEKVVLVDGAQLASHMIEHGVGVSHRAIKVPKVDSDYFED